MGQPARLLCDWPQTIGKPQGLLLDLSQAHLRSVQATAESELWVQYLDPGLLVTGGVLLATQCARTFPKVFQLLLDSGQNGSQHIFNTLLGLQGSRSLQASSKNTEKKYINKQTGRIVNRNQEAEVKQTESREFPKHRMETPHCMRATGMVGYQPDP